MILIASCKGNFAVQLIHRNPGQQFHVVVLYPRDSQSYDSGIPGVELPLAAGLK